jgi:glyoxylase-like metal-dependent hydrolase (beta-lactamase superfamily II)
MATRWDIVTIGNISRNRYWGESDDKPVRHAICTCTVIQAEGARLIVDPSLEPTARDAAAASAPPDQPDRMAAELNRRTGLKPADIHAVFITHDHGDHHAGLLTFPHADWFAAPDVAAAINATGRYAKGVQVAAESLLGFADVIPTPGHTPGHHSLRFDCEGLSVVVAGDAVMTRDFWRDRRGYFNSVDFAQASRTIEYLATLADAVVPGHDNWFLNKKCGLR